MSISHPVQFAVHNHDERIPPVDQAYLLFANEFEPLRDVGFGTITSSTHARLVIDCEIADAIEQTPQIVTASYSVSEQDIVCGALMFSRKPNFLARHEIHYLVVDEQLRGLGVGSQLLRASESIMAEQGLFRIGLRSRGNTIPFYERHGYRKLTSDKWDKRMVKNLSPFSRLTR